MELSSLIAVYVEVIVGVAVMSLVFYPFELLAPAEKGQPFTKRLINLAYVPVVLAFMIFIAQPIANLVAGKMLQYSGPGILHAVLDPEKGLFIQILLALVYVITWDLFQYWLHRWQHTSAFLWQTHRFHHSDTALNATTQTRHHVLSSVLSILFYFPLLILIGRTPHAMVGLVMFRFWPFVNHANLRLPFGPLTPLIAGPQWHRIHHSIEPQHRDKNFATFFPFIDIIFGTYYRPARHEYPASGVSPGEDVHVLRDATVQPLLGWSRQAWGMISRRAVTQREAR